MSGQMDGFVWQTIGLEIEDDHWLMKMEEDSCSSLTGKEVHSGHTQWRRRGCHAAGWHPLCWLSTTCFSFSAINILLATNFTITLQLKRSLPKFYLQFRTIFWPTGLPSFVTACHPTFSTFFKTVAVISQLSAVLASPTGSMALNRQWWWARNMHPPNFLGLAQKTIQFFASENSWGLFYRLLGFCPQGRKPSGP